MKIPIKKKPSVSCSLGVNLSEIVKTGMDIFGGVNIIWCDISNINIELYTAKIIREENQS